MFFSNKKSNETKPLLEKNVTAPKLVVKKNDDLKTRIASLINYLNDASSELPYQTQKVSNQYNLYTAICMFAILMGVCGEGVAIYFAIYLMDQLRQSLLAKIANLKNELPRLELILKLKENQLSQLRSVDEIKLDIDTTVSKIDLHAQAWWGHEVYAENKYVISPDGYSEVVYTYANSMPGKNTIHDELENCYYYGNPKSNVTTLLPSNPKGYFWGEFPCIFKDMNITHPVAYCQQITEDVCDDVTRYLSFYSERDYVYSVQSVCNTLEKKLNEKKTLIDNLYQQISDAKYTYFSPVVAFPIVAIVGMCCFIYFGWNPKREAKKQDAIVGSSVESFVKRHPEAISEITKLAKKLDIPLVNDKKEYISVQAFVEALQKRCEECELRDRKRLAFLSIFSEKNSEVVKQKIPADVVGEIFEKAGLGLVWG